MRPLVAIPSSTSPPPPPPFAPRPASLMPKHHVCVLCRTAWWGMITARSIMRSRWHPQVARCSRTPRSSLRHPSSQEAESQGHLAWLNWNESILQRRNRTHQRLRSCAAAAAFAIRLRMRSRVRSGHHAPRAPPTPCSSSRARSPLPPELSCAWDDSCRSLLAPHALCMRAFAIAAACFMHCVLGGLGAAPGAIVT